MVLGYAWLAAALWLALPQPASAQGYWYNGQYYTYPDTPPYPGDPYYGPPTSAPPPSPSGKKSNAGAIAGGVIGGVVGIALLVGLVVWYRRYRARNSSPGLPQTTQSTTATPLVPSTAMPGKTASGGMGYSVGYASNAPFLPSPGPLQAKLPGSLAAVAMPTIPSKAVSAYPAQSGTLTESHVLLVADATTTTNPVTTTTNPVTTTGPAGAVQMSTAGSQAALLAGVSHGRGRAADVTGGSGVGTSDSGVPRTPGSAMGGRLESRTLDSLRISWSEIQMSGELGRGGFAVVYKGQWCGNRVAVKVLNPDKAHESVLKALYQEALIMSELRSPCLVRVFGLVDEAPHHALVMQYYRKGTLARYMSTPAYVWLDTPARLRMAIQVASGMRHLHSRSILHSDLKSSNILLDDDGNAVIADFGLASLEVGTPEEQAVQTGALTISISPPEVLQDPRAPRTQAGDVYAFGIVLLEIMSGRPAYSGLKALDIRHLVISGRRPVIPETVPPAVSAIISNCWQQEPAARPGFGPVLEQLQEAARQLAPEHDDTTATITQTGMY